MFEKVLIANRGEIAVRVARTCHELGVSVVAVHSDLDAKARHVAAADEAVHLPGVSALDTYLDLEAVIEAARSTGAEAVHPGYGFLSERADAAEAVAAAGLVWVGPPADAIRAAGDKVLARRLADSAGVSPVPGTLAPIEAERDVLSFGERHGYPIAIKAAGGGGGRGLKVAGSTKEVASALESAVREAEAYFGSGLVYLERYLSSPKHLEVQILASEPGEAMWLGVRDCSLQRRHQKLVEETPPSRFADIIPDMGEAAVRVADACGYANAGTVEFLLDTDDGRFYFLEVNARLQVEHTITEEVLGIDLVAIQLRIAAGEHVGFRPDDLTPSGHAIECRINAEDPSRGFLPTPGRIDRYVEPSGPGVRIDSGFGQGDEVPSAYDSLIAKLVVHAATREEARAGMLQALDEFVIEGIATTIPAHLLLLRDPSFVDGTYTTRTVEGGALDDLASHPEHPGVEEGAVLMIQGKPARLWHPAITSSLTAATTGGDALDRGAVTAPMHGTILKLLVAEGDVVRAGDPVAVLEAMKMETRLAAVSPGTVKELRVEAGAVVEAGQVVVVVN